MNAHVERLGLRARHRIMARRQQRRTPLRCALDLHRWPLRVLALVLVAPLAGC